MKRYAIKDVVTAVSHSAKSLKKYAGEKIGIVAAFFYIVWAWLTTPIVDHPRQATVAASILLIAGAGLLWQVAWTMDAISIQGATIWRLAFLGLGVAIAGLATLTLASRHRRIARSQNNPIERAASPGSQFKALKPLLVGGVSLLWVWLFQWLDVWNAHFDLHTWHYYAYTPMRLVFMLFLAMALIGTGRLVFAAIGRRWEAMQLGPIETVLAAFFAGASIWYLLLFVLGLLGLINRYVVVPAFVISVPLALPLLTSGLQRLRQGVKRGGTTMDLLDTALVFIPLGVLVALWLQILVNRGLAVTGFEYDSSGHYLPYYRAVVENGGTAVNELWYHFWMTKGAGLHFVAVMLTDLQGPQLVSFLFLTAAIATLVVAVRRFSGSLPLSFGAAVLFLAPFVHGFASYQKLHIITLSMMGGLLWLMTLAWRQEALLRATWLIPITLLACAATLHTAPMAAILVPFLALTYGAFALVNRNVQARNCYFCWTIPAGIILMTALGMLALNYALTGVMELTPFRLFWNLADQTRFNNVVSPYLMLFLDEGTSATTGNASLSSIDLSRLADLLQLGFIPTPLRYLAGFLLLAMVVSSGFDKKMRHVILHNGILPTFLLLLTAALLSLTVKQPGSIDRFYIFALFPLVLFLMMLPADALLRFDTYAHSAKCKSFLPKFVLPVAIVWACISSAGLWTSSYFFWNSVESLGAKASFELGNTSFRDAFLEPQISPQPAVWPRREISATCLAARTLLSDAQSTGAQVKATKVWTMAFLLEAGCHIMPGVEFMLEISNRFGNRWHRIVLDQPPAAIEELKRIGVRHLFVDLGVRDDAAKTGESTSIFGCLPYSPLLSPESVRMNFSVRNVGGDAYLLSLKDVASEEKVPPAFAEKFALKIASQQIGLGNMAGICSRLRDYHAKWQERWPVQSDPALPKLQGWQ